MGSWLRTVRIASAVACLAASGGLAGAPDGHRLAAPLLLRPAVEPAVLVAEEDHLDAVSHPRPRELLAVQASDWAFLDQRRQAVGR